jgi:hypothetical protein
MKTLERSKIQVLSTTDDNVTISQLDSIEQSFHLLLTEIHGKNLQPFDQDRFRLILEALVPFKTSNMFIITAKVKRMQLISTMLLDVSTLAAEKQLVSKEKITLLA